MKFLSNGFRLLDIGTTGTLNMIHSNGVSMNSSSRSHGSGVHRFFVVEKTRGKSFGPDKFRLILRAPDFRKGIGETNPLFRHARL